MVTNDDEPASERAISLPTIASEINTHHREALDHASTALEHARRAGELLRQAKGLIPHGGWLSWLAGNCAVSPRQAQRYMRVADNWDRITKNDAASYLTIDEALRLTSSMAAADVVDVSLESAYEAIGEIRLDGFNREDHDAAMRAIDRAQHILKTGFAEFKATACDLESASSLPELVSVEREALAWQNAAAATNLSIKRLMGKLLDSVAPEDRETFDTLVSSMTTSTAAVEPNSELQAWTTRIESLPNGRMLVCHYENGHSIVFHATGHPGFFHFYSYLIPATCHTGEAQETVRPASPFGIAMMMVEQSASVEAFYETDDDGTHEINHDSLERGLPPSRDFLRQMGAEV